MELKVGENYRLSKKIGGGSFGDIYMGYYNNLKNYKKNYKIFIN
jgi:hypothetical protein